MTASKQIELQIDRLYRLPPEEFTAARNAIAKAHRSAGNGETAARVAALPKPSVSAWLVNHLYWTSRREFERLLRVGKRLRAAQQQGLRGRTPQTLRKVTEERREALAALTAGAHAVLRDRGRTASRDVIRRVETTLDAIAAQGGPGAGLRLGRLVRDLDPPGFDAVLSLAAQGGAPPRQGSARRRSGQAAREKARQARNRARASSERAAAELETAQARVEAAVREQRDLKRRLEKAAARVKQERAALGRARAASRRAAASLERAERAVAKAERALRSR